MYRNPHRLLSELQHIDPSEAPHYLPDIIDTLDLLIRRESLLNNTIRNAAKHAEQINSEFDVLIEKHEDAAKQRGVW